MTVIWLQQSSKEETKLSWAVCVVTVTLEDVPITVRHILVLPTIITHMTEVTSSRFKAAVVRPVVSGFTDLPKLVISRCYTSVLFVLPCLSETKITLPSNIVLSLAQLIGCATVKAFGPWWPAGMLCCEGSQWSVKINSSRQHTLLLLWGNRVKVAQCFTAKCYPFCFS